MPLEKDWNIYLLEDLGEDAGLFRHLGFKPCGNALYELLAWDRPSVARAEMGELPRLDVGSTLIADQDYDVACKRHFFLCEFIHKLSRSKHVGDWHERPWVCLVDILEDNDTAGKPCGFASDISFSAAILPAGVSAADLGYELLDGIAAHVDDLGLPSTEFTRPCVTERCCRHRLAGPSSAKKACGDGTEASFRRRDSHRRCHMRDKRLDGFLLPVAGFGEFILYLLERLHPVCAFLCARFSELNVGDFLRTGHDIFDKCRVVRDNSV